MEIPSAEQSVNSIINNIHKIAQANQAVGISIGTVISPPPELKVAWNNIAGTVIYERSIKRDIFPRFCGK